MEYFDDAWYKGRIGRNDMLHTRMTTLAGLVGGGGTFVVVFFYKTFSSFSYIPESLDCFVML